MPNVRQFLSPGAEVLLAPRPATGRLTSVLVHADLSGRSDRRIAAAAELANAFGAKLIGVSTPAALTVLAAPLGVEGEAIECLLEAASDRFAALSATVRGGSHWERLNTSPSAALHALGWAADVVVIDHAEPDFGRSWRAELETLLAAGACPVLVRSYRPRSWTIDRIIVAWDESAACRRAILGALPFMGRARGITLVAPPWRRGREREEERLEDARRGLLARGLPITVARLEAWSAAHILAASLKADLVVMGVEQGRLPWRGWPIARDVAARLNGPVLVSG